MLDEVHRLLAEEGPMGPGVIARRLEARGFGRRQPSTIQTWLKQLQRDGRITADRQIRIPPLYPAYLLLDLPEPRRGDVMRVISARDPDYAMDTVTGIETSTIVRTTCRQAELARIREECLANGAVDAKALLVLRTERRSA